MHIHLHGNIPTYAYIVAAPNPIGVGQTIDVYMWLDAGIRSGWRINCRSPGNGYTASAALLSNNYRFQITIYTITAPAGASTTTTFATICRSNIRSVLCLYSSQVGTYTITFNYPGQVYGAKDALYPNGDGYQGSPLYGDYYLPSNASTTLTVQSTPIPAATGSSPLPTAFWTRPIFGENTNWFTISSNWLGTGSPYA